MLGGGVSACRHLIYVLRERFFQVRPDIAEIGRETRAVLREADTIMSHDY